MTTTTTKFSIASTLAARFDVGFERSPDDASWATTDTLRGAEADALVTDLQAAGIEASKAYDTDDRSRAWVYASLDEAEAVEPVDPTADDLEAIRRGAYNDRTRRIERCGIRLSHDEADAIGDVGCGWLVNRLNLHVVTDDRGTMFLPRAS